MRWFGWLGSNLVQLFRDPFQASRRLPYKTALPNLDEIIDSKEWTNVTNICEENTRIKAYSEVLASCSNEIEFFKTIEVQEVSKVWKENTYHHQHQHHHTPSHSITLAKGSTDMKLTKKCRSKR